MLGSYLVAQTDVVSMAAVGGVVLAMIVGGWFIIRKRAAKQARDAELDGDGEEVEVPARTGRPL